MTNVAIEVTLFRVLPKEANAGYGGWTVYGWMDGVPFTNLSANVLVLVHNAARRLE